MSKELDMIYEFLNDKTEDVRAKLLQGRSSATEDLESASKLIAYSEVRRFMRKIQNSLEEE